MSTCVDNARLGRTGCGATYSGDLQHSVARVPWSRHPDGLSHVTASLSVIDRCWAKGGREMADPVTLGFEQDASGRWRQPMTESQRARLALIATDRRRAVDLSASDPVPLTDWVPMVDISRHQGATNFHVMRSKGVKGLILRISNGMTLDDRCEEYYHDAIAAGFAPGEIGFYPFLNPKRGSGADTAAFAVVNIRRITGRDDFLYMLDIENYRNESPNVGQAPVFGAAFAAYIRQHIAMVKTLTPKSRVIGYTNRSYWNGKVAGTTEQWVGDDQLASELDWIVARYPAYSEAAYTNKPLPPDSRGWGDWAFKAAPDGPFPPRGGTWDAWQFSAGFNRQGQAYGCSSSDLDLNIVHPDAWAEWTSTPFDPPPPNPQPEDDMKLLQVQGDPAVILVNGDASWVSGDSSGLVAMCGPILPVPRATYKYFYFDGPEPDYGTGAGNGPTKLSDFRGRRPQPTVTIPPIVVPPLTGHISADLGAQGHITGSVG